MKQIEWLCLEGYMQTECMPVHSQDFKIFVYIQNNVCLDFRYLNSAFLLNQINQNKRPM